MEITKEFLHENFKLEGKRLVPIKGRFSHRKLYGENSIKNGYPSVVSFNIDGKNFDICHVRAFLIFHGVEIPEKSVILFKDGDTSNLTLDNLAVVNHHINACERSTISATGYRNVYSYANGYKVQISKAGILHAKTFKNLRDAVQFANTLRKHLFGKLAYTEEWRDEITVKESEENPSIEVQSYSVKKLSVKHKDITLNNLPKAPKVPKAPVISTQQIAVQTTDQKDAIELACLDVENSIRELNRKKADLASLENVKIILESIGAIYVIGYGDLIIESKNKGKR